MRLAPSSDPDCRYLGQSVGPFVDTGALGLAGRPLSLRGGVGFVRGAQIVIFPWAPAKDLGHRRHVEVNQPDNLGVSVLHGQGPRGGPRAVSHVHSHALPGRNTPGNPWSRRYWTMISWPEAAASIRGVYPQRGSLQLALAPLSSKNFTIC